MQQYEIIAVDDGSTDDTLAILRGAAAQDARLRVVANNHQGIVGALQTGLAACRAELVARMDADDRSLPQRLEKQYEYLQANPAITVLGCRVAGFPPDQVRQGFTVYLEWQNALLDDAGIRREMFVESPLAHPSVMFRREWVERVGGYQPCPWAEDYDLWMRLYLAGARFARLPEVLFEWRERPDRLTRRDGRYSLENFLRLKAYYLCQGPLAGRDGVILWGAGMAGRRLSKHLQRQGAPLLCFVDIDPRKIGNSRRGLPILPAEDLPALWKSYAHPVVLAAVGARGARPIIRRRLAGFDLVEGSDWWFVA
jgi:glycosyltransferase involved in cell wall biosynthesis